MCAPAYYLATETNTFQVYTTMTNIQNDKVEENKIRHKIIRYIDLFKVQEKEVRS